MFLKWPKNKQGLSRKLSRSSFKASQTKILTQFLHDSSLFLKSKTISEKILIYSLLGLLDFTFFHLLSCENSKVLFCFIVRRIAEYFISENCRILITLRIQVCQFTKIILSEFFRPIKIN